MHSPNWDQDIVVTKKAHVVVDGNSLTLDELISLRHPHSTIELSPVAIDAVNASRAVVDKILAEGKVAYGINTGFGSFAKVVIPDDDLVLLQNNLIKSHAAGVGKPVDVPTVRMIAALRINILAKGYSGISLETLQGIVQFFNSGCLSLIPSQGTVGASGDLAPLAHLALGFIGEGRMYDPDTDSYLPASEVIEKHQLVPLTLKAKEGLALINGTQFIVGIGAYALYRAKMICNSADIVASLTLESLRGSLQPYSQYIHLARPHNGQIRCAKRIYKCLTDDDKISQIMESHKTCNKVQDAYSLRCVPQVHGVTYDTLKFVENIIVTEMNSATDNPMVISETGEVLSGGNFHGEYPAKALDYLTIAINELAKRLLNTTLSDLPHFLVKEGGINSGFMIPQCTAAALLSENKVLCHPSSCDSISTSAQQEDHVSMGGYAARKALKVVKNVEHVLAIELLASCQAIEFLRPLKSTSTIERIFSVVREKVTFMEQDRYISPDIHECVALLISGKILKAAQLAEE